MSLYRWGACPPAFFLACALLLSCCLGGCGYHVAGATNLLPAEIHTIAITPWANSSMQFKLSDHLAESVSREMTTRTRYKIVADPAKADAVLLGSVVNLFSSAAVADPITGRSTGALLVVQVQVRLMDKAGKMLFERPNIEFRERYEISVNPQQYFDESGAALERLSRDVARTIVSAIIENFDDPAQFLARVKRNEIPPVCLFLGQEGYNRTRCREALIAAARGVESEQYDASETSLAAIVDDARSMSLFASERLIFAIGAETAMPRSSRGAASADDDEELGSPGVAGGVPAGVLEAYVKSPTPGVTLIFEATRWDLEGEDKAKSERVRKFFGAIPDVVEFRSFTADEARIELNRIAREANLKLDPPAAEALVEALAADVARIAVEVEKLSLYGKPITVDDLALLVPDARQSTIFALVNALGRRDRVRSLETLDALVREGEYLPLALTFLATQFRMALVAKEANLRGASQVQSHFQRAGVQMWGSRAEQVSQTAAKFSKEQLERGLKLLFETDRDLRSARPDDRTVVENFVVRLCA